MSRGRSDLTHVRQLNHLLDERARLHGDARAALGLSYLTHTTLFLAIMLLARAPAGLLPPGEGTIFGVVPLYGDPDGGSLAAAAAIPPPEPEAAPETMPPAITHTADYRELTREPTPRPTRSPKPRATPTPHPTSTPRTTATKPRDEGGQGGSGPSNDELLHVKGSGGTRGQPGGVLGGDPNAGGGGLDALMFTNQWYVGRIRDIIYRNWGNPFSGRARPEQSLQAVVSFRIDRQGMVSEVSLLESSGNSLWDRAALRAAENSRLPPLPADYPGRDLRVRYRFYDEGE